ncbi:MAG TPA: alpha/beta hydrolase [Balneolaceae bacterium]|nr:alpha/beta hydrolase [Balneolaceae bacterium]
MSKPIENIPNQLSELDNFLAERESKYDLKPDTNAKIVWNSASPHQKTDFSIVYLHGFRASRLEGYPVHQQIAKKFGYNLFLARLEEHGMNTDSPLLHLTEEKLLDSARFAFEIGRRIGKKVILMGTSTGGSLALWLAAQEQLKRSIEALILYSPLIDFYGLREKLLVTNWFRKLLQVVPGKSHIMEKHQTAVENKIWYDSYALQGALALGALVQHHMKKGLFSKIQCPVFTGYYYKNFVNQDKVVSVSAIKRMMRQLGSDTEIIRFTNFPHAQTHVICSSFLSKAVEQVIIKTGEFVEIVASQATTGIN